MLGFEVRLREVVWGNKQPRETMFYLAIPVSHGNRDLAQQPTVRRA